MAASLDLWTRFVNYWQGLPSELRYGIVGGLVVAAVAGAISDIRNALIGGIKRLFKKSDPPAQPPQLQQPTPTQHEVIVKVDTSHLIPPPQPEPQKTEPPQPVSPAPSPEFLRSPAFGFVARRDEQGHDIIERLKEELALGRNQLVTLSGKGGVGKTTIAAEAFRVLGETYAGRLVWSDATGRAGYTLATLLDEVATQLGRTDLRALAPEAKEAAVRAVVAERPALVALDNYETVDEAERGRIERWLAHAPCAALITSRQPVKDTLNVVIPTMLPDEAQEFLEKRIAGTLDSQLFSAGVRQRIYETAEGNPYLMEWVVAQVDEAQEPETVLEELKHGEGDAAERVFGRSFNLPQVGEDGRAALLALSLFVPSASRSALAAVAGFGDHEKRLGAAIKSLHALWLIKGLDGNSRFTVEGLTRSLTSARLSKEGREDEFRQRFIAYFLQYALSHKQKTPEDYDALEAEKNNLFSTMDAAFELENWKGVIIIRYTLEEYLDTRGYWDEAIKRGEQAIEAARTENDEIGMAVLAINVAIIRQKRGEYAEAKQACLQAIDAFRKLGDKKNVAAGLHLLGILAQNQGDTGEARELYNESLEISRLLGNQSSVAITLHELGRLAQAQGNLDEARELYNESLEIKKALDDRGSVAITLHELGRLAQAQGNLDEARELYNESLEISRLLGNQSGVANTLHELGRLAQAQGELDEARRLYDGSLGIERRLGNQSGIAISLAALGLLEKEEGNLAEAERLLSESLSILERLGSPDAEIVRRHLEGLKSKAD
jgi:tetratricopeptide (TPR) repeat protein